MNQENCTGQYVSAFVECLHCFGCPNDVITWFLTISELVVWIELFCTCGIETIIIMDETKVAREIGYLGGGVMEFPAQPELIQEVVWSQRLRHDG